VKIRRMIWSMKFLPGKLWQGHTMGLPILGTTETVANFDRRKSWIFIISICAGQYGVSIAGNIGPGKSP
jgi:hypothetical protein